MSAGATLYKIGAVVCVFGILFSTSVQAGPKASFEGGGSLKEPNLSETDGFPGTGGNGWDGPWEMIAQNDQIELDAKVIDDFPFTAGSGQYLQLSYTRREGESGSRGGVLRPISNIASPDAIDPLKPYQVSFQFRIDQASGDFENTSDQIMFAESYQRNRGGSSDSDRWMLLYRGGSGSAARTGGTWIVFHGGSGDRKFLEFSPPDFEIQTNDLCDVKISVDPGEGKWDVEITYQGVPFRASDANAGMPLELRGEAMPSEPTFLSFRTSRSGEEQTLLWSIDNIELIQ